MRVVCVNDQRGGWSIAAFYANPKLGGSGREGGDFTTNMKD